MLSVKNITKTFGERVAVNDLSFKMTESGVFGLIGTNGAGKTTSIRVILGIMKADSGSAQWNGRPISRYREIRIPSGGARYIYEGKRVGTACLFRYAS